MDHSEESIDDLLFALKERAKELNCLYEIEELFSKPEATLPDILQGMIQAIPPGWQYPDVCRVKIHVGDLHYQSEGWKETPWVQTVDVVVQDQTVGSITVAYMEEMPTADEGPFLKEERKLINTIADRLERRLFHERMKTVFEDQRGTQDARSQTAVVIDLLEKTDAKLLARISRKMLNFLSWSGVPEAEKLLKERPPLLEEYMDQSNKPIEQRFASDLSAISDEVFDIARKQFGEKEVLNTIQEWIVEDRSNYMMKILENPTSSLSDIINAIERFQHRPEKGLKLSAPREEAFRVALIRRLLNDDGHYIQIAKRFLDPADFHELWRRILFPAGSRGRVGGKGSGLFLAEKILNKSSLSGEQLRRIKIPKTWYLTSDAFFHFINHNDLEEVLEQKYEDVTQLRQEYPYIVHVFKNSPLPQEIMNGLSVALDDFGETPLVVRSSSLLEEKRGSSFAGKYKSLFIANQGTKNERLRALAEAITEVYASTFNPDAIEYRTEHGMIDSHEAMGILIQQVIGVRVGDFFLPVFGGVAFSKNEFRWSPRIRKDDGLLRIVPGLGTRAVDRISDDYPILLSPGQPNVSVNVTREEKVWYSPKNVDVINLKTRTFETIDLRELFQKHGREYPMVSELISLVQKDGLKRPGGSQIDFEKDRFVVTFEGLFEDTDFLPQLRSLLNALQSEMGAPVDIEFAHDGTDLYILQCRYQSFTHETSAVAIPDKVPREKVLFSANRFVTNGAITGISHIVYVDPIVYAELENKSELLAVGRAIGKLNQILPKRRFILMGPGRWGSRGDIKLGVSVTYSDIKNAAMLIEIARKKKGYVPELSFGTHFFQDLVESAIHYLPLYPDDDGIIFKEEFLLGSPNVLPDLVPEFSHLQNVIHVIDVGATAGTTLQVFMNGDRDQALAVLADCPPVAGANAPPAAKQAPVRKEDSHWRWRMNRVEQLAERMDPDRFGVKAMFLFGSTKDATAGPQSDIDLLVHFQGTPAQEKELMAWLEGWSLCLSEENFLRTGLKTSGLLDVHLITDEDIARRTSFASKIGSITDPPRPLPLRKSVKT